MRRHTSPGSHHNRFELVALTKSPDLGLYFSQQASAFSLAPTFSSSSTKGSHLYHVAFTGLLILAPKAAEKPRTNLWESATKLVSNRYLQRPFILLLPKTDAVSL